MCGVRESSEGVIVPVERGVRILMERVGIPVESEVRVPWRGGLPGRGGLEYHGEGVGVPVKAELAGVEPPTNLQNGRSNIG